MNIITDNFDVIENDVTITDFNIIYNFDIIINNCYIDDNNYIIITNGMKIIINNYLGTNEDNT